MTDAGAVGDDNPPPAISLRVLGPVDLRAKNGEPIGSILAQPKRLALLAFLAAAHPRGFHRRDQLLGLFWPDLDREHARAALRNALYVLRQELGGDIILGRGDEEVGLDFGRVWCDVVEVETALAEGEEARALDLYRGDLLEGFLLSDPPEFDWWLEDERGALREKVRGAAHALARRREEAGDLSEAIRWTRRVLVLDPFREPVLRHLLELLDRAGNGSGAIQVFQRFAERLQDELEMEPSPETLALVQEIRNRERAGAQTVESCHVPPPVPLPAGDTHVVSIDPEAIADVGSSGRRFPRYVWRWIGALVFLVVVGLGATRAWFLGSDLDDHLVAVLPFENQTGDPALDDVVGLAAETATRGIARGTGFSVVASVTVEAALPRADRFGGDPAQAVAALTGAGILVTGSVHAHGDSVLFAGQILDPSRNRTLYVMQPVSALPHDPDAAVGALVDQIIATLARHADFGETMVGRLPPPNLAAYREYRLGLEKIEWASSEASGTQAALEHFKRAAEMDSSYAAPLLSQLRLYYDAGSSAQRAAADSVLIRLEPLRAQLTPSEEAYLDLMVGVLRGRYDNAAAAGSRGFTLDPSSFAFPAGFGEMLRNRPEAALRYFQEVDTVHAAYLPVRGFSWVAYFRASALHMLGRHQEELTVVLKARERFPEDPRLRQAEVSARVALGQPEEVDRLVAEGLGLGDESVLFLASREYRAHGQEALAVAMAERLLEFYRDHCPPSRARAFCQARSADQLVFLKRYPEALEVFRELWLDPFKAWPADGPPVPRGMLSRAGIAAALAGDTVTVRRVDSLLAHRDDPFANGQDILWRAIIGAYAGRPEDAVALIRQAVEEGVPWSLSWHLSEWYEPLRGYPPFDMFVQPKG